MIDNYGIWEAYEAELDRQARMEEKRRLSEEVEDEEVERIRENTKSKI